MTFKNDFWTEQFENYFLELKNAFGIYF